MTRRTISLFLPLVALAVGLATGPLWGIEALDGAPVKLPFLALLVGFIVAELLAVEVESRNEAHSINFVEFMYVAALVLSAPVAVIVARPLAGLITMGVLRRQSPHKVLVNVGVGGAEAAATCWVFFSLIGERSPAEPLGWLALWAATATGYLVSSAIVTVAITVFNGYLDRRTVVSVLLVGGVIAVANTTLGIVLIGSLWNSSPLGWLVVAVVGVLFALYRAYTALTERHKRLETLHDFTRGLAASEIEELEGAVVHGAREILRGEQGALLLPPARQGLPAIRVLSQGDDVLRSNISPTELAADLAVLLPRGEAQLFEPGQPLPGWLAEIGVKDAAIVPLTDDGVTVGAMVVANRLTEVSSFVEDDLRLFETLANHASVALANGRLVAALQHDAQEKAHQALHDPLTGLPNRTMLTERLGSAMVEARGTELGVALLFLDLGTFKEVNDTLGTPTGDRLLLEVRERIQAVLPERAELARFTGDQFAVLVTGVAEQDRIVELAELLMAEFDSPFTANEVSLVLGANVGIAHYPEHATTADLLLQRADAATYRARQEGSGIEVYAAETDPYAPRRLALAAELREALERDEVDVYVQPKVSLRDGQVVGAEALVRWTHPRLGPLTPDSFIPAAEHTGVIRQLTSYVVRNALAQCRVWRDAGLDLGISVNLSGRNLFDTHLVEDIGAAIDEAGVPASSLTFELTESTVMGESHRSMAVLEGLQHLGVRLSVDDFGTGYSSLTHLRSLPVTELKIDKSFVMTMTVNDQDAVIVRTLVELGRSLGLKTVAEGVESPDAQAMLREYGCDEGQGYLFSRPVPAEQFTAWLARQPVRRIDRGDEVVLFNRDQRRVVGGDESR
ncbi:MAG: GGDEF domain-containing protein [Acidimicrobiales bacterium]